MSISDEQRQKVYDWLDTPPKQRIPLSKKEFRESLRLSSKVFKDLVVNRWVEKRLTERQLVEKRTEDTKGAMESLYPSYDSEGWLGTRTERADKALIRACEDGNAAALKIYYQLTKRLIEKSQQEVTHKIDGNYLAREILRARRELEDSGMAQVPDESSILSGNLRLSSGQESKQDS